MSALLAIHNEAKVWSKSGSVSELRQSLLNIVEMADKELTRKPTVLSGDQDFIRALRDLIPYAESRLEDLTEAKDAGTEDPDYPGTAECSEAVEFAKSILAKAEGR